MKFRKLISELHRRNVFKSTVAYLAVAWVVIQIASILLPAFDIPDYVMKILIVLLAVGLVMWVVFSWIYDLTPQGLQKTDDLIINEAVLAKNNIRLNRLIIASLTLSVILLLGASFWAGVQWSSPNTEENTKRIAVLPLQFNGSAEDSDYFNEGMTESLIDEFSKTGDVTVLSLASSRYLTAGFMPVDGLMAREIEDIQYFIHGSLEKVFNQIKLNIKVSETIDGAPKWEKSYASDLSEINQLFTQIVQEVGLKIGLKMNSDYILLKAGIKPVKPETYELYLKGKYFLNKSTMEDWLKGLVYLQEAIDQNAADPDAYAGLAEGYITLGHNLMPPKDVFPKALAAAKRAIQLDSANAEGWASLAHYHTYFGWDWDLAEYAFNRSNEINPNIAYNHYHRAWYLALFGRMDEAIAEHIRAQDRLTRFPPFTRLGWLYLYMMVGEYEKGIIEADKALEIDNDHALSLFVKGNIYFKMGREKDGLELLYQASKINYGYKYMGLVRSLFKAGKKTRSDGYNQGDGESGVELLHCFVFGLCLL